MAERLSAPSNEIRYAQVIGILELGPFLGFAPSTVRSWRIDGVLPPADYPLVNNMRAWRRLTIVTWAAKTGKLPPWLKDEGAKYEPAGGFKRKRRTKAEMDALRERGLVGPKRIR
jgi:hypothetical protein